MPLLQTGPIRLALLDASGTKLKTLYLPAPDKDGLGLEWAERGKTWDLDNGGQMSRLVGFLPILKVRWGAYDERPGQYAIGLNDGNRPGLEDLLWLLSQPSGRIRVSPGLSAGGFTVDRPQVKPIGRKGTIYTGLEVTFRGRTAQPSMALEVF